MYSCRRLPYKASWHMIEAKPMSLISGRLEVAMSSILHGTIFRHTKTDSIHALAREFGADLCLIIDDDVFKRQYAIEAEDLDLAIRNAPMEVFAKCEALQPTPREELEKINANHQCDDPVVEAVVEKFRKRSAVGIKKYGVSLADSNLPMLNWLRHHQEELMDAVDYVEKQIQILEAEEKK